MGSNRGIARGWTSWWRGAGLSISGRSVSTTGGNSYELCGDVESGRSSTSTQHGSGTSDPRLHSSQHFSPASCPISTPAESPSRRQTRTCEADTGTRIPKQASKRMAINCRSIWVRSQFKTPVMSIDFRSIVTARYYGKRGMAPQYSPRRISLASSHRLPGSIDICLAL